MLTTGRTACAARAAGYLISATLWVCAGATGASAQAPARDGSPVALHAGIAFSSLADAELEPVQALSGQDLFSQVKDRESRTDFAVFVSQRLWSAGGEGAGAYATLGTNVSRPGDVVYLGGSFAVSRAMVTIGAATALIEEGLSPVRDDVFRGSGDRELFAAVSERREWGFFAAVSFALLR